MKFRSNFDKNLDNKGDKELLFKKARIYTASGDLKKTWFVYFYARPELGMKFERIRITGSINKLGSHKQRLRAAQILRDTINEALADGWSPYEDPSPDFFQEEQYINIVDALNKVVEQKKGRIGSKTLDQYKNYVNDFILFLSRHGLHRIDIRKIRPIHVQRWQDELIAKKLNPVTVNKKVSGLSTIFQRLVKLQYLDRNPVTALDSMRTFESDRFEPYTDKETKAIAKFLKENKPRLFLFWLHIYYAFIRPGSIVALKRKHYNFDDNLITIPSYSNKSKKIQLKQMLQPLKEYLLAMNVDRLPPETHVFSKNLEPGNTSAYVQQVSAMWKLYVMEKLGINKRMYAGKHTGGIDFLNENIGQEDIAWLKMQMGHSTLNETDIYVRKKQVKLLDETKAKIKKL